MKRKKQSDTALLAEAIGKLADALNNVAAKMPSPPILQVYRNPPLGTPHDPYQPYATWGGTGGMALCDGRQPRQ